MPTCRASRRSQDLSPGSMSRPGSGNSIQELNPGDRFLVIMVPQVSPVNGMREHSGAQYSKTLSICSYTLIVNAKAIGISQCIAELLSFTVVIGMINGVSGQLSHIMQDSGAQLRTYDAHFLCGFCYSGFLKKSGPVKRRLGNGNCFIGRAIIDTKIPVESSAPTIHRWMGKSRHGPGRAITVYPVFRSHQANIAHFIAQPGIGKGLNGIEHVPILGAGDAFKQVDLRITG